MQDIEKIINWFYEKKSKGVTYSMINRYGVNNSNGIESYDCSSAIYYACISAFNRVDDWARSTATLPNFLENLGFEQIAFNKSWNAQRGDIIIWAEKIGKSGATAHTGIFTDNSHIIHCNYKNNGITEDSESSLMYLYNRNWIVFRLIEKENKDVEDISIRKMVLNDRAIDNLPNFCIDRNNVGNTVNYIGFVVTLTKKWNDYYYSQYLNGWVHESAFEDIIDCNFKATLKNKDYSIDNLPWTKRTNKWYKHDSVSDKHLGKEFTISAKTQENGGYYYIHELAKWVDNRAFL